MPEKKLFLGCCFLDVVIFSSIGIHICFTHLITMPDKAVAILKLAPATSSCQEVVLMEQNVFLVTSVAERLFESCCA